MNDDLISRQAAIEELMNMIEQHKNEKPFHGSMFHWTGIKVLLLTQPTVDAEPVRHGYWIERYGVYEGKYYKCPVCNYNCSRTKENYCSYCGAKMDLERRTDGQT